MKKIFKFIIVFIIIIISFNLFLFLSSSFPSSWIENNVRKSSQRLNVEGNIPLLANIVFNDNFTDAIMINTCYSIDNSNPIFSYLSRKKKLYEKCY